MKNLIGTVLALVIQVTIGHCQLTQKFSYDIRSFGLGERQPNDLIPPVESNPQIVAHLATLGAQGYELVSVTTYTVGAATGGYNTGVSLIMKKSDNPGVEFYQRQGVHIDSIANNYVQKEIGKLKLDLISLVNSSTKNTITKELMDTMAKTFEAMLKSSLDNLKVEILREINKN